MTEEQKQQVIRLRKEGCGYTAVAHNVGVSKDTVKSFCRRNGLAGRLQTRRRPAAGSAAGPCSRRKG